MKYDFDTPVDREGCGLSKHIHSPESLRRINAMPFTGAEMDFKTAPVIIDALTKRAQGGIFGSTIADKDYLDKVVYWMREVRDWEIASEWIVPAYGTVHAIHLAVRAFTREGDGVIIQPPVYPPFADLLLKNKRQIRNNPLIYKDGHYAIDFDQLETLMREPNTRMLLLCNPQNPCTRIWDLEELKTIAKMAKANDVLVVSDEIYAELGFYGYSTPAFGSVEGAEDIAIVCTSLGKSFNFVGPRHANVIIPSGKVRERYIQQRDMEGYGSMSPFMYTSVLAAYSPEGKDWLDEMVRYVTGNVQLVQEFFRHKMPSVTVAEHQACCLVWLDWRKLGLSEQELHSFLVEEAAIAVGHGERYGLGGEGFTRVAIGTPRSGLQSALDRLYVAAKRRGFAE